MAKSLRRRIYSKRTILFQFYCLYSVTSHTLGFIRSLIRTAFLFLSHLSSSSSFLLTYSVFSHPPSSIVCFSLILFLFTAIPLTLSVPLPSFFFHGQTLATGDSTLLITPESTAHLVLGCKATAHGGRREEWRMGKW